MWYNTARYYTAPIRAHPKGGQIPKRIVRIRRSAAWPEGMRKLGYHREKSMEINEIRREMKERLANGEKLLIGIGSEWKEAEEDREAVIRRAAAALLKELEGKDYYIISTLTLDELTKRGFEKKHMVAPLDVSLTEEEWDGYMKWLAGTLNRRTVLLELGEGFLHPSLIRWPFEKTAALNQKAHLYRIHRKFYQITDELKEKATAVKCDSAEFMAEWEEEEENGSNQQ